jgi:two-component system, NtrC family, response regulator AtoC
MQHTSVTAPDELFRESGFMNGEQDSRRPVLSVEGFQPQAYRDNLDDETVFVAASSCMRDVRSQVRQIADFDIPVLLLGESGTGKGVVASMIHAQSSRARRMFMKVNCAALPGELLESELFGHEAGAFTGATRAKPGKFQVCDKGTILLDEIVEIPIGLQAKLLHVLQDGEFSRLGSTSSTKVDVRIIAATNRDVSKAIREGRFREDLFYRLNAYSILLPPLSQRQEDIPELLVYFMAVWAKKFNRPQLPFSPALMDACLQYHWPGNVRELENFVRRYLIVGNEADALKQLEWNGDGNGLDASPSSVDGGAGPYDLKSRVRGLKKVAEKEAIIHALELTGGSRKEAAKVLNISVRALQYKIRQIQSDYQESAEHSLPHGIPKTLGRITSPV